MRKGTLALLCLAIAGGAACKGGDSTPTAPTTVVGSGSGALPMGQAIGASTSCVNLGVPAASGCTRLTITCPSVATAAATVRVTRPAAGVANRGTIVLSTGGDGTNLRDSTLTASMISTFIGDGVSVAEVTWEAPGIWGGPQARTLACRYATAATWVYTNVHSGGRTTMFAAQGTSGGSSQIAFALAHYGLGDVFDLANLGGGPPGCPLCSPDGVHGPEPLLPAAAPAVNRNPILSYPATVVRFFLGDGEPTPDIVADANAYYNAITSSKSFTMVPGTGHVIEGTQAGVDAFVASVRSSLK